VEVIRRYLEDVIAAMRNVDPAMVDRAVDALETAYLEQRAVYVIGNGGSAANASHFAQDLSKGALGNDPSKRFRVLSLVDSTPFITAVANDLGYAEIFEFQLRQFAGAGDWLVAISGSGNSANVLKGARFARSSGVRVMGFTGFDGGALSELSDVSVHVPLMDMSQTEAVHAVLMHLIVDSLRDRLAASREARS